MISAQFAAADDKYGLPLTVAYSPATRGIDSATNLILASKARTIELLLEDVSGSRVAPGVIQDLILVCAELAAILQASKPLRRRGQLYCTSEVLTAAEAALRKAYDRLGDLAASNGVPVPDPQPPLKSGWTYWDPAPGPITVAWSVIDVPDYIEGTKPLDPA